MSQPTPPPQSTRRKDAGRIPGKFAISNCVEIRLIWQITTTRQAAVTLNGRNPGTTAVNISLANNALTQFGQAWESHLALYSPTAVVLGAAMVRDMSSADNPFIISDAAGFSGTSASPLMPQEVALVLTENISVRGRGAKGRLYIPGFATNADNGDGTALDAVRLAMNAMGTAWIAAFTPLALAPALAKPARQAYVGVTGTPHDARDAGIATVTSYVCQDVVWDSQRRRSPH
jgi:hypothetical protein